MNNNTIIVLDFETGGLDPKSCEITQLACCAVNPRTLQIGDIFDSECRPEDENNLDDKALEITHKTKEELRKAPPLPEVWKNFKQYLKNHTGKTKFNRPIRAGYNILSFDNVILDRLCDKFGDVDSDGKQNLFSDFISIDMMTTIWMLMENSNALAKFSDKGKHDIKFTTVSKWLGLGDEGAHNAKTDVLREAKVMVKFLNWYRRVSERVNFEGTMADEKI